MTQAELLKLYDFTGQTFVVTGGTGILCSAMVKALVGCGANVAVLARSEEKGAVLLAELNAPDRAIIVSGDVLQPDTLHAAAEKVIAKFGRIDGLLNGAGGNSPKATAIPPSTFFDLPEEAIRYVFDLNLYGTLLPTQIFGRYIAEQKSGADSYAPLVREIMHFFQTGTPPVTAEETLEIIAFMEAADESKRRGGTPVKLSEVVGAVR